MTTEIVLCADAGPVAFGPAKALIGLLEAERILPVSVRRSILHRFADEDTAAEAVSLTDGASLEGQIRYSLSERTNRVFAAYADAVSRTVDGPVHLRVTAAEHLDEGTRALLALLAQIDGWSVSLEPGRPQGRAHHASGTREQRIQWLHAAESLTEPEAAWMIAQAQEYLHVGDAWTALALLEPLAVGYGRPSLHQVLAVGNVMLGHPERAERHYQAWADLGGPLDRARAKYGQSMLYARHHQPYLHSATRAAQLLDSALADLELVGPELEDEARFDRIFNRNGYALLQFRAGEAAAATAFIDQALADLDDSSERNHLHRSVLLYNRAQILRRTGRSAEAVPQYRALLDIDPYMPEYHMELAQCHMEAGDWRSAAEELDLARDIDPWIPEGHALRGQVATAAGEPGLALDCHRRAWRLAPQRADLAYAYAYALSECEDWQGVLDTLAGFDPTAVRGELRADISVCTAEALLNLGRAHDAMELLEEAAELSADDEAILENLAAVTCLVMAGV